MTDMSASLPMAILGSYLVQWIKNSPYSWLKAISPQNPNLVRLTSLVVAALATAGIAWSFAPESGTLTISGLTPMALLTFLAEVVRQAVLQDFTFRAALQTKGKPQERKPQDPDQNRLEGGGPASAGAPSA